MSLTSFPLLGLDGARPRPGQTLAVVANIRSGRRWAPEFDGRRLDFRAVITGWWLRSAAPTTVSAELFADGRSCVGAGAIPRLQEASEASGSAAGWAVRELRPGAQLVVAADPAQSAPPCTLVLLLERPDA